MYFRIINSFKWPEIWNCSKHEFHGSPRNAQLELWYLLCLYMPIANIGKQGRLYVWIDIIVSKGTFTNYVDQILPNFDPLPLSSGQTYFTYYLPFVTWHPVDFLLTPSPPLLVHVVIEWPLTTKYILEVSEQSTVLSDLMCTMLYGLRDTAYYLAMKWYRSCYEAVL